MSPWQRRRGVPDPGDAIDRPRLHALFDAAGDRPIVLTAPSGYGKTVAAAHWAQSFGGRVSWTSLQGRPIALDRLVNSVLRIPGVAVSGDMGILDALDFATEALQGLSLEDRLVVLDDVAGDESGHLGSLLTFAQGLRGMGVQFLITTRALDASHPQLREACVIGRSQLAMTYDEVVRFIERPSSQCGMPPQVDLLYESSRGHPALLSVLARTREYDENDDCSLDYWVRHLVREHLDDQTIRALSCAALLGEGSVSDLNMLVGEGADEALSQGSRVLPLIRVDDSGIHSLFSIHDLAVPPLSSYLTSIPEGSRCAVVSAALGVLALRSDWARCIAILSAHAANKLRAEWLSAHAEECIASQLAPEVDQLMNQLPVQEVMSRPDLLLAWADALGARGEPAAALARARAAYVLLSQSEDHGARFRAATAVVEAARDLGRTSEALTVAREALQVLGKESGAAVELMSAYAATLLVSGEYDEATGVIARALAVSMADESGVPTASLKLQTLEALRRVVGLGDFAGAATALSQVTRSTAASPLMKTIAKGNLGVVLLELGRLRRAEPLLSKCADLRDLSLAPYYRAPYGLLVFARGKQERGLALVSEGIGLAERVGDEAEAAASRVYQAIILRAAEMPEQSLVSAERSFEALAQRDYMNFRRLAALEVGASLLALGDVSAARSWAEPVVSDGFGSNQHHALRAAMILAECDRRDGDADGAVERLRPFKGHIATENSNWQAAMYIRAFPALLGMFAEAYGVKALPSHMLRMVLPQHAERSLRLSKSFMHSGTWEELGLRVLGKQQFAQLVERKGQPICHVRLFGGLEVSIDGRVVQERDWRKRKARLVFAMLAVRRGADTPRDELLDHLWPDLDEERAKNNFYVAWSAMKSALMNGADRSVPSPYIESARGRCRIRGEAVRLDLDDFDEALALAREAEAAGQPRAAISAYERMSAAYRGDVLPGDVYDDWFAPTRDNYRMQFVASMMRATELLLEQDDPCEALLFVRRGLSVDPLREDLYQVALRCHILAGQRSAAIDTFLQCRSNLGDELGLDPSTETMKLYQEILAMEERPRTDTYGLS